jgi:hypothetical protein
MNENLIVQRECQPQCLHNCCANMNKRALFAQATLPTQPAQLQTMATRTRRGRFEDDDLLVACFMECPRYTSHPCGAQIWSAVAEARDEPATPLFPSTRNLPQHDAKAVSPSYARKLASDFRLRAPRYAVTGCHRTPSQQHPFSQSH